MMFYLLMGLIAVGITLFVIGLTMATIDYDNEQHEKVYRRVFASAVALYAVFMAISLLMKKL